MAGCPSRFVLPVPRSPRFVPVANQFLCTSAPTLPPRFPAPSHPRTDRGCFRPVGRTNDMPIRREPGRRWMCRMLPAPVPQPQESCGWSRRGFQSGGLPQPMSFAGSTVYSLSLSLSLSELLGDIAGLSASEAFSERFRHSRLASSIVPGPPLPKHFPNFLAILELQSFRCRISLVSWKRNSQNLKPPFDPATTGKPCELPRSSPGLASIKHLSQEPGTPFKIPPSIATSGKTRMP